MRGFWSFWSNNGSFVGNCLILGREIVTRNGRLSKAGDLYIVLSLSYQRKFVSLQSLIVLFCFVSFYCIQKINYENSIVELYISLNHTPKE